MILILDYGAGNIRSLANMVEYLGYKYKISGKAEDIKEASKILFPGQGAAKSGMNNLEKNNLVTTLRNIQIPFLGICLGMQLLFDFSEEEETNGLGIIPGKVKKLISEDSRFKIPQIGWNTVEIQDDSPLFRGVKDNEYFYFAHSYYAEPEDEKYILGKTNYIKLFASVVQKENFYGVQFHTEKSGETGLKLLKNFIELC